MKKLFLFFVIVFFIIYYSQQAQGKYILKSPEMSTVSSGGYLFTELAGDLLTVDIRDAILNEVLKKLSAQSGINFFLPTSLGEEKIMVRFSNYKIDKGLNKILSSYGRIFIYNEENSSSHQPPLTRLNEVRIYPRFHKGNKGSKVEMTSVKRPKATTKSGEHKVEGAKRTGEKKLGGGKSVKNKSKSLKDKDMGMSVEEVEILAERGGEKVVKSLALALKDKNPEVEEEAKKALEEIGESLREESEDNAQTDAYEEEPVPPEEEGEKSLTLAKTGSGNGVNLELNNDVPVRAVQFTLEGAKPSDIRTTSRTEGFFAKVNEENGTVVMVSLSGNRIAPGTGPIAEIICNKGSSARLSQIMIK